MALKPENTSLRDSNGTNSTNDTDDVLDGPSAFPPVVVGLYAAFYSIIFIMATSGNVMALMTCYSKYRIKASILLCFIASLASADLLFALLTVFDIVYFYTSVWPGGNPVCKLQGFLMETSYSASILTLVAISYERYRSVASKVDRSQNLRVEQRTIVVKAVWLVSIILCTPVLYGYSTREAEEKDVDGILLLCENDKTWGALGRQIYYSLQAFVLFLFPLNLMIWAHVKIFSVLSSHNRNNSISSLVERQRKVTKMLAVVTLVFFGCSAPFIVVRALRYFDVYNNTIVWKLSQLLFVANSACNPVLYCFYSSQFRSSFKKMVRCKWRLRNWPMRRSPSQMSSNVTSNNTFVLRGVDGEMESSTLK